MKKHSLSNGPMGVGRPLGYIEWIIEVSQYEPRDTRASLLFGSRKWAEVDIDK